MTAALSIAEANTILYCEHWRETAAFYRETLGLSVRLEKEWFVELRLAPGTFLSIADAARASVGAIGGRGVTLGWRVSDLRSCHARLAERGVAVGPIQEHPWGAELFRFRDPEGNRVEIWSKEGTT